MPYIPLALVGLRPENIRLPPPKGVEIVYGGVHIGKFEIKAGTTLISHCHVYDHPFILACGEAELWTGPGEVQQLTGPCEGKIAAGVKHMVTAKTDIVWYCIHAGEHEPEILDPENRVA